MRRKSTNTKKKMKISVKRRLNLIDLVLRQGYSIVRASKKLELKPYTAASILNTYKEKGVVFDYKTKQYIVPEQSYNLSASQPRNIDNQEVDNSNGTQRERSVSERGEAERGTSVGIGGGDLQFVPLPCSYFPYYIFFY